MPEPRILFITAFPPYPHVSGDRQRSNLIFRALSAVGKTDLFLASLYSRPYPEMLQTLTNSYGLVAYAAPTPAGRRGVWKILRPLRPALVDKLASGVGQLRGTDYDADPALAAALGEVLAKNRYDVLVGRYLRTTVKTGALAYTPLVIDIDDYDPQVYRDRIATSGLSAPTRVLTRRLLAAVERIVPDRIAKADHLWLAAGRDLPEVRHPHVSVLPNLAFFSSGDGRPDPLPPEGVSRTIITVGNYVAKMNENGVDRFVSAVWPRIRAAEPTAVFRVIGGNMTDAMKARWSAVAGVEAVGFVEDLSDEYARCAFTVAPIYEGGGTKIKVLESLARGRTVALPAHSLRGYEHALRHQQSVWVGNTDADLAQGCIKLLREPDLRKALAEEGVRQITAKFSFAAFKAEVAAVIQRLTEDNKGVRRRE
jgi:glycosyltransferase involved in cell wall biosynthesis